MNAQNKTTSKMPIPDYDHLFNEDNTSQTKRESHFLKRIFSLNIGKMITSTLVYFLQALPTWIIPLFTADIIDTVTVMVKNGVDNGNLQRLIIESVIMLATILLNLPMTVLRWNIVSKMLRQTSAGIKCSLVRKLQSLSITYYKDIQTGRLQSKFLRDLESIDGLLRLIMFTLIPNIIGVLVAVGISVVKNGTVSLFFLFVIPCNVILNNLFRKKIRQRNKNFRIENEKVSSKLTTMIEMIPVTKSHGLENQEISSFKNSVNGITEAGLSLDKVQAFFGSFIWLMNKFLSAVCLLFCSFLAIKKVITVGEIVLYQSMFESISAGISGLISCLPEMSKGLDAISSVSEVMNSKDVEFNLNSSACSKITGAITLKNVSYCYPSTDSENVINGLSLDVKAGECIAVVGSSGSGKSTLMNMIIGFLPPQSGEIDIDGKPLSSLNLSEYRHSISVVPQNSILFDGSIKDNITYGLERYTEEELNKAVEKANLNEFLSTLPNGIDTFVGEHGDKLSGGQRQRITIARALIRNPKIMILDEATSALDNISEYHVQKAIASSIKGRTTFIVAHRLSTIRNADRIVVLEHGKIIEIGTYEELMKKKGKFYELKMLNDLNSKQAEEELA